ncbi:hypothetical protein DPMN_181408 [Dreissena polymorpha]|uniref:Uncharacterized protein n=1 Tax=Dreissena polymorpha TaxID=45954 RepID=A0A9D4DDH8_DREPO|nr:hypothetical protein DPMN_181408 [Dreissena polymorpha]
MEKSDVNLDDKTILAISTAVKDSIKSSLSKQWQSMIESIVTGVEDGLSNRRASLENDNKVLLNENRMLRDRVTALENRRDASEQYMRQSNVCFFGIPESVDTNENTYNTVIKLCKALSSDVSIHDIDRSHKTRKLGGR